MDVETDDRTVLSPELVLVSPDLWEVALERLPPLSVAPAASLPARSREPAPGPPELTGLRLVVAATAYAVLTLAMRVAVGVGSVLGVVLVLMLLAG